MSETYSPIYVVDDDASMREAVGSLVRSAGLSVETFASAQEFLASPRRNVPSCLVLDVQLPGLSGLELQQELAKTPVQIPIIFLTANLIDRAEIEEGYAMGAVDFLIKPLMPTVLQAKVRGFIEFFEDKQKTLRQAEQLRFRVEAVDLYDPDAPGMTKPVPHCP